MSFKIFYDQLNWPLMCFKCPTPWLTYLMVFPLVLTNIPFKISKYWLNLTVNSVPRINKTSVPLILLTHFIKFIDLSAFNVCKSPSSSNEQSVSFWSYLLRSNLFTSICQNWLIAFIYNQVDCIVVCSYLKQELIWKPRGLKKTLTSNLLSGSRPLTPSGHWRSTFSPALVLGQQRKPSNTDGQKEVPESSPRKFNNNSIVLQGNSS